MKNFASTKLSTMKLSIIIPVYNEENTIEEILKRIEKVFIRGENR